jgi:hypothetical protein
VSATEGKNANPVSMVTIAFAPAATALAAWSASYDANP